MTDKEREKYIKRYRHLNLYFEHGRGWDHLTLAAAVSLDSQWPHWMPNWFKRFNNYLLYAHKGRSLVRTTKYYSLIKKLFHFIKEYPRFTQIKEKFGDLRLYNYGGSNIINMLENASNLTCEECGATSDIGTTKGWIKTLCRKCAKDEPSWEQIEILTDGQHTEIRNKNTIKNKSTEKV